MKRPKIIITAVVAVLFILLAGVGYFLLSNPPLTESPRLGAMSTEPPAQLREGTPPAKQLPPSFEQKIESLRDAIADVCATGGSREVTLVVTETEANDQAAKWLAMAEIPEGIPLEVQSIHIDFQTDNNLLTEAKTVAYGFIKVTIKVKARVGIEGGKPQVEVTRVSFGFVPLPKPLKDKIVVLITQQIDDLLSQVTEAEIDCNGKVNLEFTDISIQQEEVTVTVLIERRA